MEPEQIIAEYEPQLREAERELKLASDSVNDAMQRLNAAQQTASALAQIVQGAKGIVAARRPAPDQLPLSGGSIHGAEPASASDSPRGRAAILRVMNERPGPWKQADIIAEVKRREWIDPESKDPDAAIRIAVRRLWKEGELEKLDQGVYRIPGATVPGVAVSTAGWQETSNLAEGA